MINNILIVQDDSISDEEGIKKYAEYKLEFKRQQLNEFFVTHKVISLFLYGFETDLYPVD